jgi:hypothetical protein
MHSIDKPLLNPSDMLYHEDEAVVEMSLHAISPQLEHFHHKHPVL